MLIQALYELAQREGLSGDDERRRVDVVIALAPDGSPVSVEKVSEGKTVTMTRVPRMPTGRSGMTANPGLLYDNAGYILGVGKVAEKRVAAFLARTREVIEATGDAGAEAVAALVGSSDHRGRAAGMLGEEWSGAEWIAFRLAGEEGFVHERPAVKAFWAAERRKPNGREIGTCIVTGRHGPVERLHPMVRMPGTKGAALVSFNAAAFESHGREQGDNAPMCRDVVEGYVDALHWLLERTPARRHRGGAKFGDDVLLVWSREHGVDVDALLEVLDGERPVGELAGDEERVYAVLLGVNRTRIVVKSWIDTTAAELVRRIRAYLADFGLDAGDPLLVARDFAHALGTDRRPADLPPRAVAALVMAPFTRAPLPPELLTMSLRRLPLANGGQWRAAVLIMLMGAVLRRRGEDVPMALDENCTAVPYVYGRLFALCESLQFVAHGWKRKANIRATSFSAAMTRPAATWPSLLALSSTHAEKARRRVNSTWYERQKGAVLDLLGAVTLPPSFTPSEQTLFAHGYAHQREAIFRRIAAMQNNQETDAA